MRKRGGPRVFRILLGARNLPASRRFYEQLLSARGRLVAPGRVYFYCGPVILGLLDYSGKRRKAWSPPAEAIYLATNEIARIYRRAKRLGCLDPGVLHGDASSPLGSVLVRPWGERSFYARDPSGTPLCFVDSRTLFTGTREQLTALRRAHRG